MKRPGWLAVVLFALATVGCASTRSFPEALVNVTGRWEGTYESVIVTNFAARRQISMTLRQNGSKVKGHGVLPNDPNVTVDGRVEGEVFSGQIAKMKFELTVTGNEMNEMTGSAEGPLACSCRVKLHRVGAAE